MLKNILIGTDPELMIINTKTGEAVSSIGLIPGSKWSAYKISEEGHAIQCDNVLAEFNIPPTNNKEEFISHINFVKKYIQDFVKEVNPDYDILCSSGMEYPYDQLTCPEAFQIGCDPDFNAWEKGRKNDRVTAFQDNYRSAGFHIHISYGIPDADINMKLARLMDLFVGVPSIIFDNDVKRRTLYGNAGSFRHCKYGVEWRTLSGAFLKDDETIGWVWDRTFDAINAFNQELEFESDKDLILEAINNSNIEIAKQLINKYNIKTL